MSARVIPLDDPAPVMDTLAELLRGLESGEVRAVAIVAVHADGKLAPQWGASPTLGAHAGSILRAAVCWLGAEMDAEARDA